MTFELSALPTPSDRRLALRVTRDALRQIRGGHPWVYGESITSVSNDGAPGDLAVVFDADRRFAAIGLWDPHSPIRLKILHVGKPTQIDAEFWRGRLAASLDKRQPLTDSADTNAYRVVHGENDSLPSLVIDRYNEVAVIKLYSLAWIAHLSVLVPVILELLDVETLVLRLARNVESGDTHGLIEGMTLAGPDPTEPVMFLENGLRFEAQPTTGQKTGHFLDQRDNRALIRDRAAGANVLDVFSCTGGFTVHAAAGGAQSVHSIDLAGPAIEAARRNMVHNRDNASVAACRHETTTGDAFAVMDDLCRAGQQFEVVIVDPPSFAQKQSSISGALRAYTRLAEFAVQLTTPGGLLMQASCSSRIDADTFFDTVNDAARGAGFVLDEIDRTAHPLDHPIGFPQGAYLKALYANVRG